MLYFYNVSPAFGPLICVSPLSPTLPSLYTIFSSARHLCNLSSQRRYDTPAGSILRYTASSPFFLRVAEGASTIRKSNPHATQERLHVSYKARGELTLSRLVRLHPRKKNLTKK